LARAGEQGHEKRFIGVGEPVEGVDTTATTLYREMDIEFWLPQAEAELRELA